MPDAENPEEPETITRELQLVGGVNFTTWPNLKWARAGAHYSALQARFAEWEASFPIMVEGVLREDREALDLVVRIPRGIPTQEWSLTIGDIVHNLRSALDAVAWGIAHFNGATPTKPKRVMFPIAVEERQWLDAVRDWIGELNPEFKRRLSVVQPYTYAPEYGTTALALLHELDIQDKHRDIVSVSANLRHINLMGSWQYEDPDVEANPRLDMNGNAKFSDGVVLGTLFLGGRAMPLEGTLLFPPAVQVVVSWDGHEHDITTLLPSLFTDVRRTLDIAMSGLQEPGPEDEEGTPIDVRTV